MENKVFKESRIRIIWALAWPVMLSQILQTLLEIGDMYFISNLGVEEAAATGISTSILGVLVVFSQLVSVGAIALISRRTGEGDKEAVVTVSQQALVIALTIGAIVFSVVSLSAENILILFGVEEAVEQHSITYLRLVLIGVPFIFYNLTGRSILQAKGDTKTPMVIFVVMNVINIVLDPVFIYGAWLFPRMGLAGAAIATTISNIVGFTLMTFFVGKKVFDGKLSNIISSFKLDIHTVLKILKIGFYSAIQAISRPVTGLMMYKIANYSGTEAVAAFTIGGRSLDLVFIFLAGLSTSVSVLTGQSLGKGDIYEAEEFIKNSIKLAVMNVLIFAIPYFFFARYLILLFSQDLAVVEIGTNYLRIVYAGIFFVIFPTVYGGAFFGAGDTAPPMIASLTANWLFKLPFAYILSQSFSMGANGVWLAISISVVVEAFIIVFWFKKGIWRNTEV